MAATVAGVRSHRDHLDMAMHSAEGRRDPYPFFGELLAGDEGCVLDDGRSFAYGYRQCTAVLRSPTFLKHGEHASSVPSGITAEQAEILRRERPDAPGMLSSIDDPAHSRLRRLVSLAFTPRRLEPYVSLISKTLDELLAELDPTEPVDLVSTVNSQIPSQVVGELIGLPLPDRAYFARLAGLQSLGRDPDASFDDHLTAVRARREMYDYVEGLINDERSDPRDTPVGRLVRQEQDGEIGRAELVSLVATVYSAGFGTTVRMLGNGLVGLLRHPDQAAWLRQNPHRARQVTDELLRFDTPVMTVAYYAGEGAALAGRRLEPGSLCTVILGAANHDARVFDAPDVLDVTRPRDDAPLSFGYGTHYCIGASLARLEGDVVYCEMLGRYPRMALAGEPVRQDTFRARAFSEIPVVLEPS